jgi:hypothetical protein
MKKRILVTISVLLFGCAPAAPDALDDLGEGGETSAEQTGCEAAPRRAVEQVSCTGAKCSALWASTSTWSPAFEAQTLDGLPTVDPWDLWPCAPDPNVDLCVEVDGNGHVGCYWHVGAAGRFLVPVAPSCAVAGLGWAVVGRCMSAYVD